MSFADTYAQEVLESRRTRAQRARFWAKVVSLMLMLTVAVVLRTEPDLRRAIAEAGMQAVMQATGRSAPPSPGFATLGAPATAASQASADQSRGTGLRDQVKVNRPATAPFPSSSQPDAQSVANQMRDMLSSFAAPGG